MYVSRVSTKPLSKHTVAQLSKAVASFSQSYGLSTTCTANAQSRRQFTSAAKIQVRGRDLFPEPEHGQIKKTEPAWPHPPYVLNFSLLANIYILTRFDIVILPNKCEAKSTLPIANQEIGLIV
jgi:hypothetical protein